MSSMSQYSFKCFMPSYCSSTFYLCSFFPFIGIFTFIFWTAFFHSFSPYFPNVHIILHHLFFLLNNNLFIVVFNLIFWGASYMHLSNCFLLLNILSHQRLVCSSSISSLHPFFMPMCGYMSHTHLLFHGGSCRCDFLNLIWIIYVWFNFKCFVILFLINI